MTEEKNLPADGIFYLIADDDEGLEKALRALGFMEQIEQVEDAQERARALAEAKALLKDFFEEVHGLPVNQPDGEVKAIVRGRFIPVWKTLFTFVEVGAKVVASLHSPAAALSLLGTFPKLKELVKRLDDTELLVIEALSTVIFRKKQFTLMKIDDGASRDEIKALFIERDEAPPDVDSVIAGLEAEGVVKSEPGEDGKKYYELVT
jgi:hypothetical protein